MVIHCHTDATCTTHTGSNGQNTDGAVLYCHTGATCDSPLSLPPFVFLYFAVRPFLSKKTKRGHANFELDGG